MTYCILETTIAKADVVYDRWSVGDGLPIQVSYCSLS